MSGMVWTCAKNLQTQKSALDVLLVSQFHSPCLHLQGHIFTKNHIRRKPPLTRPAQMLEQRPWDDLLYSCTGQRTTPMLLPPPALDPQTSQANPSTEAKTMPRRVVMLRSRSISRRKPRRSRTRSSIRRRRHRRTRRRKRRKRSSSSSKKSSSSSSSSTSRSRKKNIELHLHSVCRHECEDVDILKLGHAILVEPIMHLGAMWCYFWLRKQLGLVSSQGGHWCTGGDPAE